MAQHHPRRRVLLLLLLCAAAAATVWVAVPSSEDAPSRRRLAGGSSGSGSKEFARTRDPIASIAPWRLGVSTALVVCLGALAAGAGIGGGGLFVPIYWLALGVGPKAAVPLSGATIFGGAIGNFVSIGRQRHPRAPNARPLVDYEAATLMQSGELLGVVFGVVLNVILPRIAIIVFLAAVLSYNSKRTLSKGVRAYRKETADRDKQHRRSRRLFDDDAKVVVDDAAVVEDPAADHPSDDDDDDDHVARADDDAAVAAVKGEADDDVVDDAGATKRVASEDVVMSSENSFVLDVAEDAAAEKNYKAALLAQVLANEAQQFPRWAYALLVPMTLFMVSYGLLGGLVFTPCARWDLTQRAGEPKGWAGGVFWLFYWLPVPVLAGFAVMAARILKKRSRDRQALGTAYKAAPNDLTWDDRFLAKFPRVAVLAGVAAGMLGIGGGMIVGPLFIAIDMEPRVAAATSAFMILWTASIGTVLYFFSGNLGWQLALWCIGWGVVSGQLGQRGVDRVIRRTGRQSYVIFLLGGIIGTACLAMVSSGAVLISLDAKKNGSAIFEVDLSTFRCI